MIIGCCLRLGVSNIRYFLWPKKGKINGLDLLLKLEKGSRGWTGDWGTRGGVFVAGFT